MPFAVIQERNIRHEGDERSRTNPGHGYPAHTETFQEFTEFRTEADMLAWVESVEKRKYGPPPKYRIVRFETLAVETAVVVKVAGL